MDRDALEKLIAAVDAGDPNRNDGTLYRLFGDDWVYAWDVIDRDDLNAAKALHEALLPGWGWLIGDGGSATVLPPDNIRAMGVIGPTARVISNPARAWLLAILKAKLAE